MDAEPGQRVWGFPRLSVRIGLSRRVTISAVAVNVVKGQNADSERPAAMPIAQVTGRISALSWVSSDLSPIGARAPAIGVICLQHADSCRCTGRDRHFGSKPVPAVAPGQLSPTQEKGGEAPVRLPPQSR